MEVESGPERMEQRIDELGLQGRVAEGMPDIVRLIKEPGDLKKAIYKVRSKESKGTKYVGELISQYVKSVGEVKVKGYRECNLVSLKTVSDCSCAYEERAITHKKELDELKGVLPLFKKSQDEEIKKVVGILTPLAIHSGNREEAVAVLGHITGVELSEGNLSAYIAEFVHFFYSLGMEYEAYKAIEAISRQGAVKPSTDRLRVMVMAKFFLKASNLRGYARSIDRAVSLGIPIRPIQEYLRYAKYQRVVTDYDKLIGYKESCGREKEKEKEVKISDQLPTVFTMSIDLSLWEWYVEAVSQGRVHKEPMEESTVIKKLSFLRRNRLRHYVKEGSIFIEEGNLPGSFIDYSYSLSPSAEHLLQPASTGSQPSQRMLAGSTGGRSEKQRSREDSAGQLSGARLKQKMRRKLRPFFEEREFLLRKHLHARSQEPQEEPTHISLEEESPLDVLNRRFQLAREETLSSISKAVSSYKSVADLIELFNERLRIQDAEDRAREREREEERKREREREKEREKEEIEKEKELPRFVRKTAPSALNVGPATSGPQKEKEKEFSWSRSQNKQKDLPASSIYQVSTREATPEACEAFLANARRREKEKEAAPKFVPKWKK